MAYKKLFGKLKLSRTIKSYLILAKFFISSRLISFCQVNTASHSNSLYLITALEHLPSKMTLTKPKLDILSQHHSDPNSNLRRKRSQDSKYH